MSVSRLIAGLLMVIITTAAHAETENEHLATAKALQVPIKVERKRVIIPTSVNGSRKLKLILDTGMPFDGVYLFHKEFADEIDMAGAIEVKVPGAGSGEASTALMIENGRLAFGDVSVDSQRVIVAQSSHTQRFPTDGIIGWNLFGHYAVEIDYDLEMITLHDTSGFKADSSWQIVPIIIKRNLPFFDGLLEVIAGKQVPAKLYIDLASEEALELLVRPDAEFTVPDSLEKEYLGTGLSGDIHGQRGFCHRLKLGEFELKNIPTAFAPAEVRSKQEGADGILGNDLVRRFNVIFDYSHNCLYLKPGDLYYESFK